MYAFCEIKIKIKKKFLYPHPYFFARLQPEAQEFFKGLNGVLGLYWLRLSTEGWPG